MRPWLNWIERWIPVPKVGGSSPFGRTAKVFVKQDLFFLRHYWLLFNIDFFFIYNVAIDFHYS